MISTDFGDLIAERVRAEHRDLARRWFDRLVDLLPVDARDVFPTESLLDHIPSLILEISQYLRRPEQAAIVANTAILEKACELGALRHNQKASLHQVLREYQLLNGVLSAFVLEELHRLPAEPPAGDAIELMSRLHRAVDALSQATVEAFVTLYTQTIADQNERLDQFTRMAAHEWRQPLGALRFGVSLLRQPELERARVDRTLDVIERNVQHLIDLTHTLEVVARMRTDGDTPIVQEVSVSTIVQEAARQLREMADARGVEFRIAEELRTITVDVGRLELVFVNLLSNAVKYSDSAKPERFVEVSDGLESDQWCRIEVRDNGIGIPEHARAAIFQRFTRAHSERDDLQHVTGVGLGLSIVDDCIREMGGSITVRSAEGEGTTFTLLLPTKLRI
jgi:signal transduction histidine kinase